MADTFHDQIVANRRNSLLLVAAFAALLAITVFAFSVYATGGDSRASLAPAAVALAAGLLIAWLATLGGPGAVLAMSGAREIQKQDDPQLWNVIEELSIAAGVPMPRVYRIEDTAVNAFATGRDPSHAAVAITRGLREKLDRDELQGVLAHELSHVRNLDIRFSMLLAVLVGFLVLLCDVFRRWMAWGGRSRSRSSGRGGGPLLVIAIALALALSLIAPLLARLIQLAASRQREYLADASSVELTRYPGGLARALEKIAEDPEVLETANRATQHLYIVNPFKTFERRAQGLFSTHPPIRDRIERLRALDRSAPGSRGPAVTSREGPAG